MKSPSVRFQMTSLVLSAVLAQSCATTTTDNVGNDDGGDGSRGDLGTGSGDALPVGALAFFKTPLCPNGWFPYAPAIGRAIVPLSTEVGQVGGMPFMPREERAHKHMVGGRLELRSFSLSGIAGEANHNVASAAGGPIAGQTDVGKHGIPYIQLLFCQKSTPAKSSPRPLPQGMLTFFATSQCPPGWAEASEVRGRHLVSLPDKGIPGKTFGGEPFAKLDKRLHGHKVEKEVQLPGHGVALASGCCASGYGKSGTYQVQASAPDGEVDLPAIALLACKKL